MSADGKAVAVVSGDEGMARFIVDACNNYTALKEIARLSRGEIECDEEAYLYRSASHKAMKELFVRLDCAVLRG